MSESTSPSSLTQQPEPDPFALAADILFPPTDSEYDDALACQQSLSAFVRTAWPILEPAAKFISGWHIDVVCEHLEAVTAGEIPRLIINQPPRTMKSLSVAVCWPAWEWLTSGHIRWLYASYAESLSIRDSVKTRRLIESRGGRKDGTLVQRIGYRGLLSLLHAQPWRLTADQNVKTRFDTTETGFRLATSVDGMATGEGGDRIVVDDPLNPKQARSKTKREATNEWWSETMTTRFNNASATAVLVMQRLHQNDLTGHLLATGGWHHLCLPAEYEPKHPFVYPDKVKLGTGLELAGDPRTEPGELLEPKRLGAKRVKELQRELGSYGYAGQLQQRPSPTEGGMFERSWWQRWSGELDGQWAMKIASWDMRFASHDDAASSYVVGQAWGARGADRYLLAQIRAHLSFTETVRAVLALQELILCNAILVERKANGEAVMNTLRRRVPGLIPIEPEGGKEVRAAAVQPLVEAENVWLPDTDTIRCPPFTRGNGKTVAPTTVQDFIEEHAVFPNGSHDDQVDAMTQAMTWLSTKLVAASAPVVVRRASRWKV